MAVFADGHYQIEEAFHVGERNQAVTTDCCVSDHHNVLVCLRNANP